MEEIWEGPYPVILLTPTAVKVLGLESCSHHSRIKKWTSDLNSPASDPPTYSCEPTEDLHLLFKKQGKWA